MVKSKIISYVLFGFKFLNLKFASIPTAWGPLAKDSTLTVQLLIFWISPLAKVMTSLDSILKSRDITLLTKVQFSSVAQSCLTLCDPMNRSMPGLPVHHQFSEFTQTHVHRVSDDIQPSHPLSSSFPPAPNPSQHQSLFQWVNSSHEVAKVLEFQL